MSQSNEIVSPIPAHKFEVFIYDSETLEAIEDKLWFEKVGGFGVSFDFKGNSATASKANSEFCHPSASYKTLTLERGLLGPTESELYTRLEEQAVELNFSRLCIVVTMYDSSSNPNAYWLFYNVIPSDWSISGMDATSNKYLVETFTFKYQFYQVL